MDACLTAYLNLCRPYQLPEPWQCCVADPNSRLGPADPAAAFAALQVNHQAKKLVAAGIARLGPTGQLELHPFLAEPNVGLVLLHDTKTGNLCNLMTEQGCVFGDRVPVFEVLGDRRTFEMLDGAEQAMFATDTIHDAILLRSFGLPAAPVVGLDRLNQQAVDLLCQYYGTEQEMSERESEEQYLATMNQSDHGHESAVNPQDPLQRRRGGAARATPAMPPYIVPGSGNVGPDKEDGIRLTLVRWTIHAMSKTDAPSMQRTIDELMTLAKHRRLELNEISNWTPTDQNFESLRFALDRREPDWIKSALLDCSFEGISNIEYAKTKTIAVAPPTSLAAAVDHLQGMMLKSPDEKSRQRLKEALNNYHRVVGQQVTVPLLRQAEAAGEPLERAMQLQFAQLNALFLEKAPRVREQTLLGLVQRNPETGKLEDKGVNELLAISAQLVALAKELKWKSRRPMKTSRVPTSKFIPARRFGNSDLVAKN